MIRVAVIGVGSMGRHHARVYQELDDATLVGVADPEGARVEKTASLYGGRPYVDHLDLLDNERPEAVSVCVPTRLHHRVTLDCLERGVHVLVEKPVAAAVGEARELGAAARRAGVTLAVGHIERFNPAIRELRTRLQAGEAGDVFQVHARRLGPFPTRLMDVGVAVDLATHDLDVMCHLLGSAPIRVYAETKRELHPAEEDLVSGLVRFANGVVGILEISWLTPTKIRQLSVTGDRGMFHADYLTQDLTFFENPGPAWGAWDVMSVLRGGVAEGAMTRFAIRKFEPLAEELRCFLDRVRGGEGEIVSAEEGLAALTLALALRESGQTSRAVDLAG